MHNKRSIDINNLSGYSHNVSHSYSCLSLANNIIGHIYGIKESAVYNNIIVGGDYYAAQSCINTYFSNNIFIKRSSITNSTNCVTSGNMATTDTSDDCINIGSVDWNDVFVKYDSTNPRNSNFHFKDAYKQYENQVGIYAGTGFNDKQLAPVPYIVAKQVDEQTDAQGKLNIRVRVKAGDTE